ncbi:hypothetical protein [Pseudoduganella buxea]|uniref:Uncharacterized protein n=1 Tax=Pseudoduganella buxea TaxID=1949069 RepID=A0A6I3SX42_9BURK|nr:hypothetical protein [Pseudoduganella buxea]MTV53614.1 hypothetical protein [Pseudoduganella buxea]GGC15756.1 hypothetical protein GCM10011572_41410 [Pseudoduganella buxea]
MDKGKVTMALLLVANVAAGAAKGEAMGKVDVQLAVDGKQDKVLVTVQLENRGSKPAYVPRSLASKAQLDGRLFDITDARTGEEVAYQGRMVKRGPLTAEDFLALAPGAKHRHTIDITPAYAFKPGKHDYRLSYAGTYGSDVQALAAGAAANVLAPAPVTFSYTAK